MLAFFGFLFDWIISRDWLRISPLLVLIVPTAILLTFAAIGAGLDRDQMAIQYITLGDAEINDDQITWAFENTDEEADTEISRFTEALFRRARELQPNNQQVAFVIGGILGQRGAIHEAVTRMQLLAPNNRDGYPPAHAWLANYLLQTLQVTDENVGLLRHHVQQGVKWEFAPAQVLAAATNFSLQENDQTKALEFLAQSAQKRPEFEAELFRLALNVGNQLVAEQTVEKSLPRLLELVQQDKAKPSDRLVLAEMLFFRKEYDAAQVVLEKGLANESITKDEKRILARGLSELFRKRYVLSLQIGTTQWTADIHMLDRAFRADPTNPLIAEEVAKLGRIGGPTPPDSLLNQLRDFLAKGTATPLTHSWLAEAYILREDYGSAIDHLTSVVSRMPDALQSHNNLAYALALSDPDRLEEAEEHARTAIAGNERVADFHDTLGFILLKKKQIDEAIVEFEQALELENGRPDFHERLAEAYRLQGNVELSDAHRRVAGELKEQASAETLDPSQSTQ